MLLAALDRRVKLPAIGLLGAIWGVIVAAGGLSAFYLGAALIACALVLFDFRVGVVMLIILMPLAGSSTLFPHDMFGIQGLNPLNVLLVGTLCSWLLHALADRSVGQLLPRALLWLYIAPILAAGAIGATHFHEISPVLLAIYPDLDFAGAGGYWREMVLKPLLMVLFAVLVGAAVAKSERPTRFLLPAVASMFLMTAIVVVFVAQSGASLRELASADERGFLSPLGLHANDLGRLYAVCYALLLFTWAGAEGVRFRCTLLAAAGLTAIALVLTFSRGSFVAFGVVNGLYVLWRRSRRTLLLAGLVLVAVAVLAPAAVYERLSAGEGQGINAISADRLNGLWLPLLPDALKHPVYGNGIGAILWSDAMRSGAGQTVLAVTHPHNAYLEALLDMGFVGLALLCAYYVHLWRRFRTLVKDPGLQPLLRGFYQGAAAALVCLLISDVTDSSLMPRPEQVFLWLAIGMMYGEYARRAAARARAPAPVPVSPRMPA
jgi:O-antigen ligase